MILLMLILLAVIAIANGTAAIYMALIEAFPIRWLFWHYFLRKPLSYLILLIGVALVMFLTWRTGDFSLWNLVPLAFMILGVILAHRLHQEVVFKAIDNPQISNDPMSLPLSKESELAVVDYEGVTKAYALDHLIHHHIISDKFGDKIVALTYCAMCRTIIPFDVTDIGPLFVASFKNANMIVADRKTKTFFQQATFNSIIGKLHPHTLKMIPFQILSWRDVKKLKPLPRVIDVTKHDLRKFELPIPGIWRRILTGESTPGLSKKNRDKTLPARTRIIGLLEPASKPRAWIKSEILNVSILEVEPNITLVAIDNNVNAFRNHIDGQFIQITVTSDHQLSDNNNSTIWDIRGKKIRGKLPDLKPVSVSDEYWFSWKRFHPSTVLKKLNV